MKRIFTKVATAALAGLAAVSLAACESPEQRAEREHQRAIDAQLHTAILAAHAARAHERCDMTVANADGYTARLYAALDDVSTQTLAQLHADGTTFCLDARLAHSNNEGRNFPALFYRASNTMALSDDDSYKTGLIVKFADQRANDMLPTGPILAGARVSSGKYQSNRWRGESHISVANRLDAYPVLRRAPRASAPVG